MLTSDETHVVILGNETGVENTNKGWSSKFPLKIKETKQFIFRIFGDNYNNMMQRDKRQRGLMILRAIYTPLMANSCDQLKVA